MIKSKSILLWMLIFVCSYYFISIISAKNGQFINYHLILSSSIKESKINKTFISILDSSNYLIVGNEQFEHFVKDSLDIWKEHALYNKRYGFLPLVQRRIRSGDEVGINLNLKSNIDWYNSKRLRSIEIQCSNFRGDLVHMVRIIPPKFQGDTIRFFYNSNDELFGEIVLK